MKISSVSNLLFPTLGTVLVLSALACTSGPPAAEAPPVAAMPLLTPTPCPTATPEPLWVEPISSPTKLYTQVITVRIGNGERVTVSAESGLFVAAGDFNAYQNPALVTMTLLPGAAHHLGVWGRVRQIVQGSCIYGGYTLYTNKDRTGGALVIVQLPHSRVYLPLILKAP